jgi:hypothetical protein
VRLFPNPLPAMTSQVRHDPGGGSWLGRAQNPSQS